MANYDIGFLPVAEDGKLVGVISESDFVKLVARGVDLNRPVAEYSNLRRYLSGNCYPVFLEVNESLYVMPTSGTTAQLSNSSNLLSIIFNLFPIASNLLSIALNRYFSILSKPIQGAAQYAEYSHRQSHYGDNNVSRHWCYCALLSKLAGSNT